MEARELRIGNFVYHQEKIVKVFSIDATGELGNTWSPYFYVLSDGIMEESIHTNSLDAEIKPITLTEEWLLKFGFETMDAEMDFLEYAVDKEDDGNVIFSIYNDGGLEGHKENPFYITSDGMKNGWATVHKIELQFVHQLQNLYFALTGEELVLKELV